MRKFEDPDPAAARSPARYAARRCQLKLPKPEQNLPEWQTAIACLIGAAEGRDFLMHAGIGVMRALNRQANASRLG